MSPLTRCRSATAGLTSTDLRCAGPRATCRPMTQRMLSGATSAIAQHQQEQQQKQQPIALPVAAPHHPGTAASQLQGQELLQQAPGASWASGTVLGGAQPPPLQQQQQGEGAGAGNQGAPHPLTVQVSAVAAGWAPNRAGTAPTGSGGVWVGGAQGVCCRMQLPWFAVAFATCCLLRRFLSVPARLPAYLLCCRAGPGCAGRGADGRFGAALPAAAAARAAANAAARAATRAAAVAQDIVKQLGGQLQRTIALTTLLLP